ncbi:hypothetical protein [Demequina subtropica]|uniref:hypothetical protein n=1 Tax=Demequina subtropica TaxID=1638989 RepID=UPI000782D011|nr:hypothetical protein [Demequina subtropica]
MEARGVPYALALGALVCLTVAVPGAHAETPSADPATVTVPYLDAATLPVNGAWSLEDCPAAPAGSPLTVECDESGITIVANGYAPSAGPWDLPVTVSTGSGSRTLAYSVALGAPDPAEPVSGPLEVPGVAGGRTLIPLASLVGSCVYCGARIDVRVEAIAPEDGSPAVRAWVADHHVVIDAPADATLATLALSVADGTGAWSAPTEATVTLGAGGSAAGLHVLVPRDATVTVTPADLVAATDPSRWRILTCAPPVRGSVACDPDALVYSPDGDDALEDQLDVTLVAPDGVTLAASVTVTAAVGSPMLAPAVPTTGGAHAIAVAAPDEAAAPDGGADAGVLSDLWALLPSLT